MKFKAYFPVGIFSILTFRKIGNTSVVEWRVKSVKSDNSAPVSVFTRYCLIPQTESELCAS